MFTRTTTDEPQLDVVINGIYAYLTTNPVDSEKYGNVVDHLVKLQKLKESNSTRLSSDAKATIGANILGILAVICYERIHVVTTKAIGFVGKLH